MRSHFLYLHIQTRWHTEAWVQTWRHVVCPVAAQDFVLVGALASGAPRLQYEDHSQGKHRVPQTNEQSPGKHLDLLLKISNKVQGLLVYSILKIMVQLNWLCGEVEDKQVDPPA